MQWIYKMIRFLEEKWQVQGRDLVMVFLSFSLTGPTILFVRPVIFNLLRLNHQSVWLRIVCYPFIMIPVFYLILLVYGCCFGQCGFFVNRLKRMGARLRLCYRSWRQVTPRDDLSEDAGNEEIS